MPSNLYLLIFDTKWQRDKKRLVYLETGSAAHSSLLATTRDKVWDEIFAHYPNQEIYVDVPDLPKPSNQAATQKIIYVANLIEKIADRSLTKGVFLFEFSRDSLHAHAYKKRYQLNEMHIINSQATIHCHNKITFYEWCEISGVPFPQTWLLSKDSFEAQKHLLPNTFPQGCIIKPQDGTVGKGTAYVDHQQLPAVLAYLHDRTEPNPLAQEPRFSIYWGRQNESAQHWPYMLQEMVSGKNPDGIETTMRIVVSVTVDADGNIEQFKMVDIIEKFPLPGTKKSSATVISLTDEMAGFYKHTSGFLRVLKTEEPLYQDITFAAQQNMTQLMRNCARMDHSDVWKRKGNTLPAPNDYITYMMPRIEGNKLEVYDDTTLENFKTILVSPLALYRRNLLVPFEAGYLGERGRRVPAFARTHDLFQLMINFIVREQEDDLLFTLREMANSCLRQYANTTPIAAEKEFYERVKYMVDLLEYRVSTLSGVYDAPTTPILNRFCGPWSNMGYFPVSTYPSYLIFDFKWQAQNNRIVYLETGSAFQSILENASLEKIWDNLFKRFPSQKIYLELRLTSRAAYLPPKYQNNSRIIFDEKLLSKLMNKEIVEGILIFNDAKNTQQARQFAKKHLLSQVIIINVPVSFYCENKIAFYELCKQAKISFPATQVVSRQTYTGRQHTITVPGNNGYVIKPPASSNGEGVAVAATKESLKSLLAYTIGDASCPAGEPEPPRFYRYWHSVHQSDEGRQIPCLIQEKVSGKNNDGIETTFRVIVAMDINDDGHITDFEVIDIVEKFPMEVSAKLPENCTRTVISLTNRAAAEESYQKPFIRILNPEDTRYQSIASRFKEDMIQFASHATSVNLSHLWMAQADNAGQANDYVSYLMPLIERAHYDIYDDSTLAKFAEILLKGTDLQRTQLLSPFKHGYFGEKDRPLPYFARTKSFYHFIMYFVLSETSSDNLTIVLKYTDCALTTDLALRVKFPNPNNTQKSFLLDEEMRKNLNTIMDVLRDRFQHLVSIMEDKPLQLPNTTSVQALTAAFAHLSRFSTDKGAAKSTTLKNK